MDLKLLKMRCKDCKQHHVMFHELYSLSSLLCIAQNVRFEIPYKVLYFKKPSLMIFKYYAWASYGLFENFHGQEFSGRDVFSPISGQAHLFWRNTAETPASFVKLATDVLPSLFQLTLDGLPRRRRQKINGINQILLVLMWLRKYLHVDTYALWFDIDIDPTSFIRIIHRTVPELWRYLHNQIRWPNLLEWQNLIGNWSEFPNAVGAIDTTPHEIYCPLTEPQRPFYSGHRHYHCMNTQLVIDNEGRIPFLQVGFLGSTYDAISCRLMEPIGSGRNLVACKFSAPTCQCSVSFCAGLQMLELSLSGLTLYSLTNADDVL